jgi:hypothetical protein
MVTKSDDAPVNTDIKFDILGGLSINTITKILARGYYFTAFNRMPNVCEICFKKSTLNIVVYTHNGRAAEGMVEFRPRLWKCIAAGQSQFELSNEEKLFELINQSESKYKLWIDNPLVDQETLLISNDLIYSV